MVNAQEPAYRHFTVNDGLPSSEIYEAYQNQDGYIYLVSDRGISRYDGYTFKNYTLQDGLPNNTVFNITEDQKKRLWFSTISGHIFYYQSDSFSILPPPDELGKYFNQWRYISSMYIDQGDTIWLAVNGHKNGFIKKHLNGFLENSGIIDSTSQIQAKYTGNGQYMLSQYEGNGNKAVRLKNGETIDFSHIVQKEKISGQPNAMVENDSSVFLSFFYAVVKINKYDNSYAVFKFKERTTKCFEFDHEGNLWVGLLQKGVWRFPKGNLSNGSLHLEGESISSVLVDKEQGYWFTTLNNGVFYLPWQQLFHYKNVEGASVALTCLNSNVWFGFNQGKVIEYFEHKPRKTFSLPSDQTIVQSLSAINGEVFINASNRIFTLKNGETTPLLGKRSLYTRKLHVNKDHELWAFGNGFYHIKNGEVAYASDDESGFHHWTTSMLKESDSSYLVGTFEGVWKFDGTTIIPHGFWHPILKQRISDIEKIGDAYIFGTIGNGILIRHDGRYFHLKKSTEGLLSNVCNAITIENDSTFWAATNRGLSRIQLNLDQGSFRTTHITQHDNLLSDEIHDILIKNDDIWVASNNGLFRFRKDLYDYDQFEIPIHLSYLKINGNKVDLNGPNDFAYNENNVRIDYTALFYKNSERINYRYKLRPKDKWTYTKNTSLQLINLSEGNYQLTLETSINGKNWFQASATPTFTINPPFWKTNWFILAVILIAGFIIWSVFNFRFKLLKKKSELTKRAFESEQKALKAQINPHFLFNALNAINSSILSSDKFTASNYLSKFSQLMRLTLNNSVDGLVTLQKELNTLELYLAMESFRMENKFKYSIDVAPDLMPASFYVPTMLVQPFAENAIWHGLSPLKDRNGVLNISFSYYGSNTLKCIVDDNGIGRTAANEIKNQQSPAHRSHGMSIIKKRLEVFGALDNEEYAVDICDKYDNNGQATGTRVQLLIPLKILKHDQSHTD